MADLDSRDKRFSMIGLDTHWLHVLPNPDGAIGQGDKQQFALKYRGITFNGGASDFIPRLPLLGVG